MQAQHPLLPAVLRWMSAIQAKGFRLQCGQQSPQHPEVWFNDFVCITKPVARARREFSSLEEFYPVLSLYLTALSLLCGQLLVLKMKIWPNFVSYLTYRAGPKGCRCHMENRLYVIKNCIRIRTCKKASINWYGMPHFGCFWRCDQVTQWPLKYPLLQPVHGAEGGSIGEFLAGSALGARAVGLTAAKALKADGDWQKGAVFMCPIAAVLQGKAFLTWRLKFPILGGCWAAPWETSASRTRHDFCCVLWAAVL